MAKAKMKSKDLVVVESPAKARTVGRFLGSEYEVVASIGHVRDLPKRKLGVDVDNGFEPTYVIADGKESVLKDIKKSLASAKIVYLATDPDREGEAIAWHLVEALGLNEMKDVELRRVVFHEITRSAVEEAFADYRDLDMQLVNAQQARRVLDRIVGYKLSPVLWSKIRGGLSAGRVQSVALRMIVDREREIEAFNPVEYWSLLTRLSKGVDESQKFRAFLHAIDGKTGRHLISNAETSAKVVADLEAFLVEDSRLRERFNVTPQSVEARFGFGEDSWEASEVELSDGRTVRFRGMIDRVDIDESGRRALVTDYKTGSITPYSGLNQDPLDGGRKLQLPIYSLATRQQMGNDVVVSAAYWFISSRSKFGLRPAAPVEIDDVSDRFKDVVAEITKGIGSGMFPANPGPRSYFGGFENCAFCEFDRICPTRRDVVWERKSADPRLAGYLGISESGEPET